MSTYRKKIAEEMCPFCKDQTSQECYDSGVYDSYYYYRVECTKCGKKYTDWYKMTYEDTEVEDENIGTN